MKANKIVFIDMDGTLVSYNTIDDKVIATEFPDGFFRNRKAVYPMICKVDELFTDYQMAILSAAPHDQAIIEKNEWLDRHFSMPKRYFIKWKEETKRDFIEKYIEDNHITKADVTLIDDEHEILIDCEAFGIQVYHPSRVLTLQKEELK